MNSLLLVLGIVVAVIALFLLLREVMMWYWRINDIVNRLDGILTEFRKIAGNKV